jgi:hypothetical protein
MVSKLNSERQAGESAGGAMSRIYQRIGFMGLWNGLGVRIIMIGTLTGLQWSFPLSFLSSREFPCFLWFLEFFVCYCVFVQSLTRQVDLRFLQALLWIAYYWIDEEIKLGILSFYLFHYGAIECRGFLYVESMNFVSTHNLLSKTLPVFALFLGWDYVLRLRFARMQGHVILASLAQRWTSKPLSF